MGLREDLYHVSWVVGYLGREHSAVNRAIDQHWIAIADASACFGRDLDSRLGSNPAPGRYVARRQPHIECPWKWREPQLFFELLVRPREFCEFGGSPDSSDHRTSQFYLVQVDAWRLGFGCTRP